MELFSLATLIQPQLAEKSENPSRPELRQTTLAFCEGCVALTWTCIASPFPTGIANRALGPSSSFSLGVVLPFLVWLPSWWLLRFSTTARVLHSGSSSSFEGTCRCQKPLIYSNVFLMKSKRVPQFRVSGDVTFIFVVFFQLPLRRRDQTVSVSTFTRGIRKFHLSQWCDADIHLKSERPSMAGCRSNPCHFLRA